MPVQKRIEEVKHWFYAYGDTFSKLASDMQSDNTLLLEYYALPARIVGLDADLVMRSPEALTGYGGVGAELERLRQCGLVSAIITNLSVSLINFRGAIIDVAWTRTFLNGDAYDMAEVYTVVHGPDGWRITTVFERPR